MAKCPYLTHKTIGIKPPREYCTLIGQPTQSTICRKCIEDLDARLHMWAVEEHNIRDRLFAVIPKVYAPHPEDCGERGDKLEGVTHTSVCCGGSVKQVPVWECNKHEQPVDRKQCLECLAGKPPNGS